MPRSLFQRIQHIEKRVNGVAGIEDWTEDEQRILGYLVTMSGIHERKWPVYPWVLERCHDEPSKRAPAYALQRNITPLIQFYESGLVQVHQLITKAYEAGVNPNDISPCQFDAWKQAYSEKPAAQERLQRALEGIDREDAPIAERRGTIPYRSIPAILHRLPIGFARKWCTAQLCRILYSPWRGASDAWRLNEVTWPPTWPQRWYYKHDI